MKKMGTFLFALALVAAALVDRPAEAANCVRPTCPGSVSCCKNSDCEAYCRSIGRVLGGCLMPGTPGGCCACRPLEG